MSNTNPKWFGLTGDGVNDDKNKFEKLLALAQKIHNSKTAKPDLLVGGKSQITKTPKFLENAFSKKEYEALIEKLEKKADAIPNKHEIYDNTVTEHTDPSNECRTFEFKHFGDNKEQERKILETISNLDVIIDNVVKQYGLYLGSALRYKLWNDDKLKCNIAWGIKITSQQLQSGKDHIGVIRRVFYSIDTLHSLINVKLQDPKKKNKVDSIFDI